MFFLGLILVIILVVLISRSGSKKPVNTSQASQINDQWIQFIVDYGREAKSKGERALLQRMLDDVAEQGIGPPVVLEAYQTPETTEGSGVTTAEQAAVVAAVPAQPSTVAPGEAAKGVMATQISLDNVSLLLYFGAFLFVTSVGLFIAFGGASGGLRTLAVLLLSIVLYGAGVWLYFNKAKLQQAGLAFVAIGLMIAPLVGVAAYNYLLHQHNGPVVWFATSLFCMALYTHALMTLRKPLISYLMIFTFLSLFESSVSLVNVPIYYYGWGLAAVGIMLQLLSRWKGYWPELRDSSDQSAQIILPLSLLAAAAMTPQHGWVQLAVSLLLASAFYGLQTIDSRDEEREAYAVVTQVTLITGLGALAYGVSTSLTALSLTLTILAAAQSLVLFKVRTTPLWQNYASVAMLTAVTAALPAWGSPLYLLIAGVGMLVVGGLVFATQRRAEAYALASVALTLTPLIYGQWYATPHLTLAAQTVINVVVVYALLLAYLLLMPGHHAVSAQRLTAKTTVLLAIGVALLISFLADPAVCIGATVATALALVIVAEADHDTDWSEVIAVIMPVPMIRSWEQPHQFLAASLIAFAILVVGAIRYRRELLRWASSGVWLVLPIAIGRSWPGAGWTAEHYAVAYLIAMSGLIFSRMVARGVVFVSSKIPLTSYAGSTSLSYVVGYTAAAIIAIGLAASVDVRWLLPVVLTVVTLATWYVSVVVEKRREILALIPLLLQGLLWSLIQPDGQYKLETLWMIMSTGLAAAAYWYARQKYQQNLLEVAWDYCAQTSLLTSVLTPLAFIGIGELRWPMALGLLVTGLLALHYVWHKGQPARELTGAIITLSLIEFLYIAGVRFEQAYVHLVVANLGLYAYWRYRLGDRQNSDNYLWAMLFTATIPLLLQAFDPTTGSLYGWWLLYEQVAIMVLGMFIHRRFVTQWGLFVAVGAVLYQLRSLGYLALGVLAIFLIGLAIYQLQRRKD